MNTVFITGRIGKNIDPQTRIIEIDSVIPGPTGEFLTYEVPVRTSRNANCHFLKAKEGILMSLQGRLEIDDDIGLLVHLELEEIYNVPMTK